MKQCQVDWCGSGRRANGFCARHNQQVKKYGKPLERTVHDRNEIICKYEYAEILLYDRKHTVINKAIIDIDDIPLVKEHKWHMSKNHVRSNEAGLHNLILGANRVDHIDRNPLNNRRNNLRVANIQENSFNTGGWRNKKTSQYKGVFSCNMTKRPWRSYIRIDGISIFIGRFHSEKEAAWMYDQYALQLFGEFAKTNFDYHHI